MPLTPTTVSNSPPTNPAIHMAGAPKIAPAVAMAPVSVADGPSTDGSRFPHVALANVATPMHIRHAEIIAAACSGPYPTDPATIKGSTYGDTSTSVCCHAYSTVSAGGG